MISIPWQSAFGLSVYEKNLIRRAASMGSTLDMRQMLRDAKRPMGALEIAPLAVPVVTAAAAHLSNKLIDSYKLLLSFVLTVYYTTLDANKQSADWHDWKITESTVYLIVGRTAYFGVLNILEGKIRDQAKAGQVSPLKLANRLNELTFARVLATMATYNAANPGAVIFKRHAIFNETLEPYVGDASETLATVGLFFTNVGLFLVPMTWNPQLTFAYTNLMPSPKMIAENHLTEHGSLPQAFALYIASDLTWNHLLISLKHTVSGMIPLSADFPMAENNTFADSTFFLKFPDCTMCYGFSNVMGKSGWIGAPLFELRNNVSAFYREILNQKPLEKELTNETFEDL